MAFLAKGRKDALIDLALEMGLSVTSDMKVIELKDLITASDKYEVEFVKGLFNTIVEDRKKREELELQREKENRELELKKYELEFQREKENRELELKYELEKLRLETEVKRAESVTKTSELVKNPTIDIKNLVHKYDLKEDISLYLVIFERQARRAEIHESTWVTHLLGLLPYEITEMIARESEENVKDYEQIKRLLLKRFKLTPEKFRQLFVKHQKAPEKTWIDFYHELCNYFDGWISGLKISTFEQLRDLMIADQIKKRAPYDFKEFFLDKWTNIISPTQLAEKIEEFEDVKHTSKTKTAHFNFKYKQNYNLEKVQGQVRNNTKKDEWVKSEEFRPKKIEINNRDFERRKTLKCFACGSAEHLRPQCPKLKKSSEAINNVSEQSTLNLLEPFTFKGTVNGIQCEILRDTGATIDVVPRKFVKPTAMTGEQVWVQQPLDLTPICLPIAEILIESELGNLATKAAVIPDV